MVIRRRYQTKPKKTIYSTVQGFPNVAPTTQGFPNVAPTHMGAPGTNIVLTQMNTDTRADPNISMMYNSVGVPQTVSVYGTYNLPQITGTHNMTIEGQSMYGNTTMGRQSMYGQTPSSPIHQTMGWSVNTNVAPNQGIAFTTSPTNSRTWSLSGQGAAAMIVNDQDPLITTRR